MHGAKIFYPEKVTDIEAYGGEHRVLRLGTVLSILEFELAAFPLISRLSGL